MDIYKKASKLDLRIATVKGALSVPKVWTLSLDELNNTAVSLDEQIDKTDKKSFLKNKTTVKDATIKLCFDIVVDILETKEKEAEVAAKAAMTRANNKKIDEIIARKQDEKLENMSLEDLEALRG